MSVNIQDLFGGDFGDVQPNSGGVYFQAPGIYVASIAKIKVDQARAGFPYFLVEFDLVESSHPQLAVGARVSWMATLKNATHKDTFRSNVKGFVLAALQAQRPATTSQEITDAVIAAVTGEQQPLTGIRIRAQAANITTREGKPFTKVTFQPYQMPQA